VKSFANALGLHAACSGGGDDDDLQQGGSLTVNDRTSAAFTHPVPNLTTQQQETFAVGRGPFDFHWIAPQLGPLFNNDSCFGCHASNGRGMSQIGNGAAVSQALIRVSLVDGTPDDPGGDVPVPGFGLQLQDHATVGGPEVVVTQDWVEHAELYGDGTTEMLREPQITAITPDGMPLSADVRTSYRQAPPLIGLGLLEAVPEAQIAALADPDDADGDGISGRMNLVWDTTLQQTVLGRFGHKASEPTLRQQVAGAFANDMGLSNKLFPEPDGTRDVSDDQFEQVVLFTSVLAVPATMPQNAAAQHGKQLFTDFGCASCHVPTLVTGDGGDIPQLAHQTIHPYTDLLLHDVGDLLTDARRDFLADGVEWRTPPLWGIGLAQVVTDGVTFLHDGRARTLPEAILWHGGEAMPAEQAFRNAAKQDRDALIGFLQTL
jgi:CxxC motif-containing protein (DUF1111 family)